MAWATQEACDLDDPGYIKRWYECHKWGELGPTSCTAGHGGYYKRIGYTGPWTGKCAGDSNCTTTTTTTTTTTPAPCACPVDPWPPASWPSNGVKETYSISRTDTFRETSTGLVTQVYSGTGDVTADPDNTCLWSGTMDWTLTKHNRDGTVCDTVTYSYAISLSLNNATNKWELANGPWVAYKSNCTTPAGSYSGTGTATFDPGCNFGSVHQTNTISAMVS